MRAKLGCMLAALLWLAVQAHAQDVCRAQSLPIIAAGQGYGALILLPARLGDLPTRVLLDTGSSWSLVRAQLVKELGLKVRSLSGAPYVDVAGGEIRRYATIPHLTLGSLDFAGDFIVLPGGAAAPYDVTIGAAMLSRFDVEIDNAAGVVSFHTAASSCGALLTATGTWSEIAFDFDEQIPELLATLDGKPVRAVLDTGASRSLMDLRLAKRLFGLTPVSPGVSWRGRHTLSSGRMQSFYGYTFKRLAIGKVSFDNVEILLGDASAAPFSLGMSELKDLHLYVAFRRKVVYARRAAGR